jgi:TetR/AcrR family transcriptional repressor of nem operon
MWQTDWKPKMDARFSPSVDPLARLKGYLEGVYDIQCDCKRRTGKVLGCPAFSMGSEISTQEDLVGAKVREIVLRKRRYLESAIRDAAAEGAIEPCDPAQKAFSLACLMEGTVAQARIMNDVEILRTLPAMGMDILRPKVAAPVAAATAS